MKPEGVGLFIVLAACATLFGLAAKRQAMRLGLPGATVPVVGAVILAVIDR
jgi:hypothetical protein